MIERETEEVRASRRRRRAATLLVALALALASAPDARPRAQDPPPSGETPEELPEETPAEGADETPEEGSEEQEGPPAGEEPAPSVPPPSEPPPSDEVPEPPADETGPDAAPAAPATEGAVPDAAGAEPTPAAAPEAAPSTPPAAARTPVWEPRYHTLEETVSLLDAWRSRAPEGVHVETLALGESHGGLPVPAVQFGRIAAGGTPLERRPTVLLLGGLDGVSLAGSEAVLAVVSGLLASPAELPADVAFVAVPWASPDALRRAAGAHAGHGGNARPVDDDLDGSVDEDPPDDLDGDGLILDLLVQDPRGPWVRVPGTRFLAPAREGEAPRYVLAAEGRDDDGDGRFNEDGPGGVCLDRNFPVGWSAVGDCASAGPAPLSEDLARRYADLALARKTAAVLVFQGNHGGVARPGGSPPESLGWALPAARHLPVFDRVAEAFARALERPVRGASSLRAAHGGARGGAAIDWFYASAGALAVEVAVWGPEYPRAGQDALRAMDARFLLPGGEAAAEGPGAERISAEDRRWSEWLDNTRGGLGFVDWHPVELGGGRQGLVGGWKPRTRLDPPEEELARATAGAAVFVRELARSLPRLAIDVHHVERRGEICRLRARVRNRGEVPTGLAPGEAPVGSGCVVELLLPAEATLLAGPQRTDFGHLPGAGSSQDVEWLVRAPVGSTLRLRAEDRLTAPVEVEVQP